MNLTVNEFTTPCPLVISTETTVIEAFEMMQKEGIHHLPVSENGQIKGVVSDRDLRLLTVGPGEKTPVGNLISGETFSIHRNTSLEDAALEMGNKNTQQNFDFGIFHLQWKQKQILET